MDPERADNAEPVDITIDPVEVLSEKPLEIDTSPCAPAAEETDTCPPAPLSTETAPPSLDAPKPPLKESKPPLNEEPEVTVTEPPATPEAIELKPLETETSPETKLP